MLFLVVLIADILALIDWDFRAPSLRNVVTPSGVVSHQEAPTSLPLFEEAPLAQILRCCCCGAGRTTIFFNHPVLDATVEHYGNGGLEQQRKWRVATGIGLQVPHKEECWSKGGNTVLHQIHGFRLEGFC